MEPDVFVKRYNETVPGENGDECRLKCFSSSKKFTRLRNGTNKYKTSPHYYNYQLPNSGIHEVYCKLAKENKKRHCPLPFID